MNLTEKYQESQCDCPKCVKCCERRPCWPTPEEAEALIKNGFADKLMLDWWVSAPNIYLVSPAIVNYEGKTAPEIPRGKCALLDENSKCVLHDLSLKPFEGRATQACKDHDTDSLHEDVAMTWNNDKGKEVVKLWKKIIQHSK